MSLAPFFYLYFESTEAAATRDKEEEEEGREGPSTKSKNNVPRVLCALLCHTRARTRTPQRRDGANKNDRRL